MGFSIRAGAKKVKGEAKDFWGYLNTPTPHSEAFEKRRRSPENIAAKKKSRKARKTEYRTFSKIKTRTARAHRNALKRSISSLF